MLRDIHLEGRLGDLFGPIYRLDVETVSEGVRALCILVPGFRSEVGKGAYQILVGRSDARDESTLNVSLGCESSFRIVPLIAGGKNASSYAKIVVGVALVAAAFYFAPAVAPGAATGIFGADLGATAAIGISYGAVASLGVAIALAGVSSVLTSTPKSDGYETRERPEERPSFLFNGPVNVAEQGLPIPICAGRRIRRAGSVVLSAGIGVEQE